MTSFVLASLEGCLHQNSVEYLPDSAFMPAFEAGSPELPVSVNGVACVDAEGLPGLCSLRAPAGSKVTFLVPGESYPFQLVVVCSAALKVDAEYTVQPGQQFEFSVVPPAGLKSFICSGEVHPQDRKAGVSSRFEARVKLIDPSYESLEAPRVERRGSGWVLILGRHALHSYVRDQGVWAYHSKSPFVNVSSPSVWAVVESADGRRSVLVPKEASSGNGPVPSQVPGDSRAP